MMTPAENEESETVWDIIMPHLEEAVASLSQADRSALLLRFYRKASLAELGQQVGISEEAAKKRVSRALEKLRKILAQRGMAPGLGLLATVLAEKTCQAAPLSLTTAVLNAPATGTLASMPQLARDVLNAWRRMRIQTVCAAAVVVLAPLFVWQQVGWQGGSRFPGRALGVSARTIAASNEGSASNGVARPRPATGPEMRFRIVAADTGRGIVRVRVPVNYVTAGEWSRGEDLSTDVEGFCSVPLPTGELSRLDVGAVKDGYVEKSYTWRKDSDTALPPGYVLRLEKAASIGGHVQDPARKPIQNAEIAILVYGSGDASGVEPTVEHLGFVGEAITVARTDGNGNWRCAVTPAGSAAFRVVARHPGYVEQSFSVSVEPNDESNPSFLTLEMLSAGKAVTVLEPGYELRGLVLDSGGNPIGGARVSRMENLNYRQDGVRTISDGTFRLTGLPKGTEQISVWKKDYAPSLATVQTGSDSPALAIQLDRGMTIPFRIVDEQGSGIAGAWAAAELPNPHNGDFHVTTDVDGRAAFEGIPTNVSSGLMFHAGGKGYFYARNLRLDPKDPGIVLIKSLHVTGKVLDAGTRQPIAEFKAIPCRGAQGSAGYDRFETKHGRDGSYSVEFSDPDSFYRVRIEAEGYEPAMSPPIHSKPFEQVQDFLLQKTDTNLFIRGTVLTADGAPAANVTVAILTFEQGVTLYRGKFKAEDGALLATTDAKGEFRFRPQLSAHTLAAAHAVAGFARLRMHHSAPPYQLQLEPWGRIEGRVVLSGKPAPNQQVSAVPGPLGFRSVREGLYAPSFVRTDDDGRFVCELVTPGVVTLHLVNDGGPSSHQTIAQMKAGETTQVQIGGVGRLVRGNLWTLDGRVVDWPGQVTVASLASNIEKPLIQPPPNTEDFASKLAILDFYDESTEWQAYENEMRSFPVEIAADGSFSVEDVQPGKYRLSVSISSSAYGGHDFLKRAQRKITGSLKEDIVVPEQGDTSAPVELGTFELKAK